MVVPVAAGDRVHAALHLGRHALAHQFTIPDLDAISDFATQAAVALELADQLARARTRDRDRIAADLHEEVIQQLFAVGMTLQSLGTALADPGHQQRIAECVDTLDDTIRRIRRSVFDLREFQRAARPVPTTHRRGPQPSRSSPALGSIRGGRA
jgi:signal transduction histidine kinase